MPGSFEFSPIGTTSDKVDRSLETYEKSLGFPSDAYIGKTVLDIGSGKKLKFAKEAAKKGIKVISINPELAQEDKRKNLGHPLKRRIINKVYRTPQPDERALAAEGQAIPLRDNSVAAITAYESIPRYLTTAKDIEEAYAEMMRVLEPGGTAYLRYREQSWKEGALEKAYERLKQQGHSVHVEEDRYLHPVDQLLIESKIVRITKAP